jgi:hypothetical protein
MRKRLNKYSRWCGVMRIGFVAGSVLAAGPSFGIQALPYFGGWSYTEEQFSALPALKQLELHNRCIVAATYAMIDDQYAQKDAKAVYYFHMARAVGLTRDVPYGQRTRFNQDAGSVEKNKDVYRSLGWTRVLKATIRSEMKPCMELIRILPIRPASKDS